MPPLTLCARHRLGALLFAVWLAGPALAHHTGPAQVPAATVPIETLSGTVEQLVVENRVTQLTTRHVALRLDDGSGFELVGSGADALTQGARVKVNGRVAGDAL